MFKKLLKLHHELETWLDKRDDFNLKHMGGRITGQDVWFCKRSSDLDLRLWVDTRVFWGHIKNFDLRQHWLERFHFKAKMQQMREELDAAQEGKDPQDDQRQREGNGEVGATAQASVGRSVEHGTEVEGAEA